MLQVEKILFKENSDEIWVTFNDVEGELLAELLPDLQDFEFSDELIKYNERRNSSKTHPILLRQTDC